MPYQVSEETLTRFIYLAAEIDRSRKTVLSDQDLLKIPPERRVNKPAAAALIVPRNWQQYLGKVSEMPFLLGRNATTNAFEVIGGALESPEEKAIQDLFGSFDGFAGPFYHLQAMSLLVSGQMRQLTYLTKGGETDTMAALREIVEEGLINGVSVVHTFPQTIDVGVPFRPRNDNIKAALEQKISAIYGNEPYAAQVVQQRGFLATVEFEAPELPPFQVNKEVSEIAWVTGDQIYGLSQKKAGWDQQEPPNDDIRNSIPLHFLKWFMEYLITEHVAWQW